MKLFRISGNCSIYRHTVPGTITIDLDTGLILQVDHAYDSGADLVFPLDSNIWIFPGFVDAHVHGRQDRTGKQNYKEDYRTLGEAAINGGVVAVGSMPNLPEPPVTEEIYNDIWELAQDSRITIIPYGAIAPGSRPFKNRRAPYKGFLAESVNNLKFASEKEAEETLPYYFGEEVSLHCDDNEILAMNTDKKHHWERRPATSEVRAIDFALRMECAHDFHLKIVHVSTREGLQLIARARKGGRRIRTEATPQHLFMCYEDIGDNVEMERKWRMNPPLRSFEDRFELVKELKAGRISMLASDHAPHTLQEKALLEDQLKDPDAKVASGTPQLDTLGHFLTWLVQERCFNLNDINRIAALNPGRWISQFLPKVPENGLGYGRIAPDYIGSLTVLDLNNPLTFERSMVKSKCGWSPFEGFTFPGRVLHTIVRGRVLK